MVCNTTQPLLVHFGVFSELSEPRHTRLSHSRDLMHERIHIHISIYLH